MALWNPDTPTGACFSQEASPQLAPHQERAEPLLALTLFRYFSFQHSVFIVGFVLGFLSC